jgi:hypothetical protein
VGRGAPTNYHIGNEYFRQLVAEYQTLYFCAKRSDKPIIAMKVMDILKERGSRFVRREKGGRGGSSGSNSTNISRTWWVPVSNKLAYEKVCAALRDGAPQVQHQLLSSSSPSFQEAAAEQQEDDQNGQQQQQQRHKRMFHGTTRTTTFSSNDDDDDDNVNAPPMANLF